MNLQVATADVVRLKPGPATLLAYIRELSRGEWVPIRGADILRDLGMCVSAQVAGAKRLVAEGLIDTNFAAGAPKYFRSL